MLTEVSGVSEEEEDADFSVIFGFEQLQPSFAPPFYFWCVEQVEKRVSDYIELLILLA